MKLRELCRADREPLAALIRGTQAFRADEVAVALELVDAALADPASSYSVAVAAGESDQPLGYACWGLIPMSDGAYDLYWIVVDAARQRSGVGRELLRAVEADVRSRRGRMIVIETSGRPEYAAQREFYERTGCELVARFTDFYRVGDDKLVYLRRLDGPT